MSEWKKIEDAVKPQEKQTAEDLVDELVRELEQKSKLRGKKSTPEPIPLPEYENDEVSLQEELAVPAESELLTPEEITVIRSATRYTKYGRRKGKYKFAAPLGAAVIFLAAIGLLSLGYLGIRAIIRSGDTTALKEELRYQLMPLMRYVPSPFTSALNSEQDELIQAAIYKVREDEMLRQRREGGESIFEYDSFGRETIPLAMIEHAYASLFGNAAKPRYHTFGQDAGDYYTYFYDDEKGCYYAPTENTDALPYTPVIDTVKKDGDTFAVRVGYIHESAIQWNDRNEQVTSPAQAAKFQIYTVQQTQDGNYIVLSVADEP